MPFRLSVTKSHRLHISPTMKSTPHSKVNRLRMILLPLLTGCVSSCATRTARDSLGPHWPNEEPQVNLSHYEDVQKRPGQRSDIAVAVAISGGGMRAANFAAGVLKALENIEVPGVHGSRSNLLREVDYFSSVSGGGLTVGSYITHLMEYRRLHPEDTAASGFTFASGQNTSVEGRNWKSALSKNYQSSIVASFFNPKMIGQLDRGDVLESRLDDYVLGQHGKRSLTLGDVFKPKGTIPLLPYWIANATVYENGAIFPFTPDILQTYGINRYSHRLSSHKLASPYDLPLSVAMKTSASFPVAIPPTTLRSGADPKNPQLHLIDGGVSDNLGFVTALRLLKQDSAKKKVLIIIDAYNGRVEPFSKIGIRPGMILSALRSTNISLDSAHQRVNNLIHSIVDQRDVAVAIVDFNKALQKENAADAVTTTTSDDTALGAIKRDETSPQSIQAIFTQALGIGTWFKIKPNDQETLLKAGENAIYHQSSHTGSSGKTLLPEIERVRRAF